MPKIAPPKRLWRDGRLAWPFVVTVAFLAAAWFLFDLAWRVMKMPIDQLLVASAAVFAVSFVGLLLSFRLFARAKTDAT